ncbi:TetR/AcrR family transcriptional regulator [Cellulomonas carbonis]|uniref:TetR family transcriptional regulator n=1 Tax=Cellulomonas carbonis T26 TaxID=947969 RepID=A0A0A0BUK4_9CELL|nr:TetR/AcrR family transcriptional regulator [Cellulomonas carbonis]KGM12093.1 TetR family transcriptional regulator [Cellulomonas carbonis T26]GGC08434.1 TetR family transcriptional regulator [Cellulomonas carbonis]
MAKGDRTRGVILEQGIALAYRVGLEGLTIGALAAEVEMSKSGMYAHFGSKQALQIAVLDAAGRDFAATVVEPALRAPRGEPRIRALVDSWLTCGRQRRPGGCLFVKAGTELDEQPGPVRDRLVELHEQLDDTIARIVTSGVEDGLLRPGTDARQFAADLYAIMLGFHHRHRLLGDARAEERARAAVDALLAAVRVPRSDGAHHRVGTDDGASGAEADPSPTVPATAGAAR